MALFFEFLSKNNTMAGKENKGGFISNEQLEKDLAARGKDSGAGYHGSQDTGDGGKREVGTPVQQADGAPPDAADDGQ